MSASYGGARARVNDGRRAATLIVQSSFSSSPSPQRTSRSRSSGSSPTARRSSSTPRVRRGCSPPPGPCPGAAFCFSLSSCAAPLISPPTECGAGHAKHLPARCWSCDDANTHAATAQMQATSGPSGRSATGRWRTSSRRRTRPRCSARSRSSRLRAAAMGRAPEGRRRRALRELEEEEGGRRRRGCPQPGR